MRQIEFRGQVINTKEWVRGNLLSYPDDDLYLIEYKIGTLYTKKQVKKETIGQFVGINDKNGENICEGSGYRGIN